MSQPLSASTSSDNDAKADQIAHRFFNKFALLVSDARATAPVFLPKQRVDKWFNLETAETEQFKDALRAYRTLSSSSPQPLVLNVVLVVPELTNGEVVVFHSDDDRRVPVRPTPEGILLEQWTLAFTPATAANDVVLSTVYKHAISTFRSLYTLLRVLPAWKCHKRASRRARGRTSANMSIELQLGEQLPQGVLYFGSPLSHTARPISTSTHSLPPVVHPSGTLSISARFLSSVEFSIDALESLLSSTFLRQDQPTTHDPTRALEFTPTVQRYRPEQQQHGSLGTGSSPGASYGHQRMTTTTTGMPASAPRPTSGMFSRTDVDRFIVPRDAGRIPTPTSDVAFPSGSGVSPKLALLKLEDRDAPGSPTRSRQDSGSGGGLQLERTGSSASGSADAVPPSPVSFPTRRPSINAIHPFKSGTLSGSFHSPSPASLRAQSPLTTIAASTASTRGSPSPLTPGLTRPISFPAASGMLVGSPSSISPIAATRPSPPYTPSSLAERRSIGAGSASGGSDPSTSVAGTGTSIGHKRYSSTFQHRYSTPSTAMTGAGQQHDDQELSTFVQAIDTRQPLRHAREASGPDPEAEERALRGGAIPTSQREVGDALREMHEKFAKSLEGLETRRRHDSGSSGSGSGSAPQDARFRAPGSVPDPVQRPSAPFRPPAARRDSGGVTSRLAVGFTPASASASRPPATRRESGDPFARPAALDPFRSSGEPASPFRSGDPAAVFSRPPIHRRDSTEPASPFTRAQPSDASFARPLVPAAHRRDSTEPASPFRQPESPSARQARPAPDSPNPYARPSSNSPRLVEDSPFRDSDDNASDRGSVQLRWRPRVDSRGGGGTDSDGERAGSGAGGSASDIVGRMEL